MGVTFQARRDQTSPAITGRLMQLTSFIEDTYGLSGTLTRLEGELDENYLLEGSFGRAVFKLMRVGCDAEFIEMQVAAHEYIEHKKAALNVPQVIKSRSGQSLVTVPSPEGNRLAWMISFLPGTLMAKARPWTNALCASIGVSLARLDKILAGFDHPKLDRALRWDLLQAGWVNGSIHLQSGENRAVIEAVMARYDALSDTLNTLPRAVTHNDANEMNIFVDDTPRPCAMTGLIDFGDMIRTARISEPVIAAAYAMMDADDPLATAAAILTGYNSVLPLTEDEIALYFPLIETRLAVSVTNSAERRQEDPDDPYLTLHEAPAWRLLQKYTGVDRELLKAYFRLACGHAASPTSVAVGDWLKAESGSFAAVFPGVDLAGLMKLDLSYGSSTAVNTPEAEDTHALNDRIARDIKASGTAGAVGGWGEARPIYTGKAYGRNNSDPLAVARTHHLGVDISLPEATSVHAPYEGTVWAAGYAADQLDYGGYVILQHTIPSGEPFYSLYGHLDAESLKGLQAGAKVAAGDKIGALGAYSQNGGWWPHLHLQLMTETPPRGMTPPGACEAQFWPAASALCPNPAYLLNVAPSVTDWQPPNKGEQLARRAKTSPTNQKLTYTEPFQVSRGWKHFLSDQRGRTYIDAYNNVPHVGHANPAVVEAVTRQMELVSTNTRYIHESLMAYAEALTAKLPAPLNRCLFTSSASEANELAIRLARKATGANDMLVMEHGYHGITTGAMAISPYKFNQPGGEPKQDWVHVTPQPDPYRGRYRDAENVAAACAEDTRKVIRNAQADGRKIAGFISECLPSVGGQIVMPDGSLEAIYSEVRAAGGLCIADDVQTSLGRLGDYFWGFEYQRVVPDMVVLGKPIGNGHPLAAVITTDEIADKFASGPEFFTTFGGSTVSCTAGLAVLEQMETLETTKNAREIGAYLRKGFERISTQSTVIGQIRGMGLFWGLDLVKNPETREPATDIAGYVKNRLYERGILIGTDGPADNVLKIRPPLTFDKPAADALLHHLEIILKEKPAQI